MASQVFIHGDLNVYDDDNNVHDKDDDEHDVHSITLKDDDDGDDNDVHDKDADDAGPDCETMVRERDRWTFRRSGALPKLQTCSFVFVFV